MWQCTNCDRMYPMAVSACTQCINCAEGVCMPTYRDDVIAKRSNRTEKISIHLSNLQAKLKAQRTVA